MLTTEQQERMRRLVRRSPAFIGMKIVVHDDHVEVVEPSPLLMRFRMLIVQLAQTPEDDWADAVDDYFRTELAALARRPLDAPTEEILGHVYQRVLPRYDLPSIPKYAREIAPGLLWTLAYDEPDSIRMLTNDDVERHGLARLSEAGYENLCREVPDDCRVFDHDVYFISGSPYVGSLLLATPWVAQVFCGDPDPERGVLVSAPARDALVFHVVREPAVARDAIGVLADLAAQCYEQATHPILPVVHWARPGRLERVAVLDDGDLHVQPPEELRRLLG